jgi:hypothetical protein
MAIEGPLRELALSDVFQLLDLSRKTGVLTIRNDGRERPAVVRFDRGAVVGAELFENGGRIGHLLLRAGKVTEAEVEAARREQQARPGWPLGSILLDMGVVSAADLRRQLRFQIEEAVFDLVRWQDGYFRFEESSGPDGVALPVRMSTESLLMEAARRIDEWTTLEKHVPHMNAVPALLGGGGGAKLDLDPDGWEVLAEIDGERSLKTIASEIGRSEFDIAKIIFTMVSAGLVEILSDSGSPVGPGGADPGTGDDLEAARRALEERDPQRALHLLQRRIQERPDAGALLLLSRVLARLGRWSEAVRALRRSIALDPLAAAAHFELGWAAAQTGDLRQAEDAWATYLRLPDADGRRRDRALRGRHALGALRAILEEGG